MKRIMTEVLTFNVTLHCDCGGQLVWNNITLTVNPPIFPHICDACGTRENLKAVYPTTETMEMGEPQEVPFE